MKKYLAVLMAVLMLLALCACGDAAEETEAAEEVVAEAEAPVAEAEAPVAEAPAAEGDWAAYQEYVCTMAGAGAPTEDEAAAVAELVNACTDMAELEAVSQMTVLFENGVIMTYEDWVAAGCPEADTTGVMSEAAQGKEMPEGEKKDGDMPEGDKAEGEPAADGAAAADKGEGAPEGDGETPPERPADMAEGEEPPGGFGGLAEG